MTTDLIGEKTISSDFGGFTAAVISPMEFPLIMKNEIQVKPGTDLINNFTIKNVINRLKENDQTTANFTGFELVFLE